MLRQKDLSSILAAVSKSASSVTDADTAERLSKLKALLAPQVAGQEQAAKNSENLKTLSDPGLQDMVHNGGSVHVGDLAVGADPYAKAANSTQQDRLKQQKMEGYSKRLENLNDFNSQLKDLDALTNSDGAGGILSNPKAKLQGTGKFESAVPTGLIGLAESIGAAPKGSAETRKSLERLQLAYAKAMGGARGVNPSMIAAEKKAMGYMASGDPDLVKKGVLSLADNVRNHYKTIRAGYTPDVVSAVHESLGGDPTEAYSHLPVTGPAGSDVSAAPQSPPMFDFDAEDKRRAAAKVQQKAAPQQQQQPPMPQGQ
jgi:hypothetical protein